MNSDDWQAQMEKRVADLEAWRKTFDKPPQEKAEPAAETTRKAVVLGSDGVPRFNVVLSSTPLRKEQQKWAILLLMAEMKLVEAETTSNKVSALLFKAGIPTNRIDNAFTALKNASPILINSKPGQKTIFLTPAGEEEVARLARELKWK